MKIIILGGSGLIGSHVSLAAIGRGHQVLNTYRSRPINGVFLDLRNTDEAKRIIAAFLPDVVVHSAGWTWVDGCESNEARAMEENCKQVAEVAKICASAGSRLVYYSTTYVFDGIDGPYSEDALPNPINVYARSKWEGEKAVSAILRENVLIPRLICVWGKEVQAKNFVYQVAKAVLDNRPLRVPSDQRGNPTWAGDIASWTLQLLENGESGRWNLASDWPEMTRVDWLMQILQGLRSIGGWRHHVDKWYYEAVLTEHLAQPAPRPLRCGALNHRIQARFPLSTRAPSDLRAMDFPPFSSMR